MDNYRLKIYTDGSYSKNEPNITKGGIVVLSSENEILYLQHVKCTIPEMVSMGNVGGELIASLTGFSIGCGLLQNICDTDDNSIVIGTLEICYDYTGVCNIVSTQNGKQWINLKKSGMKMYKQLMLDNFSMFPNVKCKFSKKTAHSKEYGDEFNELADVIAKGRCPNYLLDKLGDIIEV